LAIANAPVIHSLHTHAWSHITTFTYNCKVLENPYQSPTNLTAGIAAVGSDVERTEQTNERRKVRRAVSTYPQSLPPPPLKVYNTKSKLSSCIQWQRVKTRASVSRSRSSHQSYDETRDIRFMVTVVQDSKVEPMDDGRNEDEHADGFDIFTGDTLAKIPLAKITTKAF
jgi:hypothetical protein